MTAPSPVTASPPRVGNPAGLAAFVLALVLVLLGIVTRVLGYAAPSILAATHSSVASVSLIFTVSGIVGLLVGLAAAVLGIIGVTRPGLPHALPAAGMAIGIFAVIAAWPGSRSAGC